MNFPTVNRKIRKQGMWAFIYFINKRLTVALATKYRVKWNSFELS